MSGARIASLVQRGYRIAADKIGLPHDHFRPDRLSGPLSDLSRVGTVVAAFDRDASFPFTSAPRHGEPLRHALVDGSVLQHGDYLIPTAGGSPLFVATPGAVHATLCVACNGELMLRRVPAPSAVGLVGYRTLADEEVALLDGWPASIVTGGRGGSGAADLPGDLPVGDWTILLPRVDALPVIRNGDVLMDANGTRYGVERAEASDLGWRITARTATAT